MILESTIAEDQEPEPKVVDETEPGPKFVVELVSLQEDIFLQPTQVIELLIETLINLLAEPTMI